MFKQFVSATFMHR